MQFSFCILEVKHGETTVFRAVKPNSKANCRTLLTALADENDFHAFTTMTTPMPMTTPMLHQWNYLADGEMKFLREGSTWTFRVEYFATMYDEKLERKAAGLAACSSDYLCTLCEATRDEAYGSPFDHAFCRTKEWTEELIDERTQNDRQESYRNITRNSMGMTSDPFLRNTTHVDALHCEINSAIWFKKNFMRETAQVRQCTKTRNESQLKEAEELLDMTA